MSNPDGEVALALSGVSKRFGAVQALRDVDFDCRMGEVHAIVGENGSGKSTLMSIAAGALASDSGSVVIGGRPLAAADPAVARAQGLAIAYQDTSLIDQLTVAQNLWLGCSPSERPRMSGLVAWAQDRLNQFPVQIDPTAPVSSLSPGQRQMLETLKAMLTKPRVLVLDEPTNALGVAEVEVLQALVRRIASEGTAVVYISHRLREVLSLADRVTVLRDGEYQGTFAAAGLSEDDILAKMVGVPVGQEFPAKGTSPEGDPVLVARDLVSAQFGPIGFEIRAGEILGLAGAEGNGQRELVRALGGLHPAHGSLECGGTHFRPGSPSRAFHAGVMSISGERLAESVFPILGVRSNLTVQVLDSYASVGVLSPAREKVAAATTMTDLGVVAAGLDHPVGALSGGNQQKVVLGRAFLHPAKVLLIDEPTQGVDARTRLHLYRCLRDLAATGMAIIVTSSDAMELAGICDRVIVMSRGLQANELTGDEVTEAAIVSSFLTAVARGEGPAGDRPTGRRRLRRSAAEMMPLLLMAALIVGLSIYTSTRSGSFFTSVNAGFVLTNATPLILLAAAQLSVMIVGGIDLSVGAQVSLTTVLGSFWVTRETHGPALLFGIVAVLAVGAVVGLINAGIIRWLRISPVIATVGMLAVLKGVALMLRETAGGTISKTLRNGLSSDVGPLPVIFIAAALLMVGAEFYLRGSGRGLTKRAVGFRPKAAHRIGLHIERSQIAAYITSSVLATCAGLCISTQIGVGDGTVGDNLTLQAVAAAVLGGAALSGGRGSYIGAGLGALFLALTTNVIPFLELPSAFTYLVAGGLTLFAILLYSGGEQFRQVLALLARMRKKPESPDTQLDRSEELHLESAQLTEV